MGLFDLVVAQSELKRLREENRKLTERLFTEIDSNRRREDELVNAVLDASEIRAKAGNRASIGVDSPQMRWENTQSDIDDVVETRETDADVEEIAAQFIAQSPYEYDETAKELLKQAIRENPQEYMH